MGTNGNSLDACARHHRNILLLWFLKDAGRPTELASSTRSLLDRAGRMGGPSQQRAEQTRCLVDPYLSFTSILALSASGACPCPSLRNVCLMATLARALALVILTHIGAASSSSLQRSFGEAGDGRGHRHKRCAASSRDDNGSSVSWPG
jgi:hypothetical protein